MKKNKKMTIFMKHHVGPTFSYKFV